MGDISVSLVVSLNLPLKSIAPPCSLAFRKFAPERLQLSPSIKPAQGQAQALGMLPAQNRSQACILPRHYLSCGICQVCTRQYHPWELYTCMGQGETLWVAEQSRSEAKGCTVRPAKFAARNVASVNSAPSKLALTSLVQSRFALRLWRTLAFERLKFHLSAWAQRGIGERCTLTTCFPKIYPLQVP